MNLYTTTSVIDVSLGEAASCSECCAPEHVLRTFRFPFMCFFLDLSIPQLQAASHNPGNKPPVRMRDTFMGPQALRFLSLSLLLQPQCGALAWGEQPFCPQGLQLPTQAGSSFPLSSLSLDSQGSQTRAKSWLKTPQELAVLWANR